MHTFIHIFFFFLKPPPSKTHTIKQMRKTELNVKHRVQNQCVLGLDMTSRLIGTGHFRPPVQVRAKVVCCAMGAHKGTYNPDSHLHSTTRIPSSDPTGLHPRPTGGPFSEESYLSAWGCSRHILCPNRQGRVQMGVRVIGTFVHSHCTTQHFGPYLDLRREVGSDLFQSIG